ncbi:MAG: polymer-forming cytoskeletal protein [Hydrogenophaga sp.]|jgi:cytoskeletal protein CcmA (bactofilin family)|uniref:bactofilin family protein n=1 Tax=Hydrogenophaga sp. TaxID=1904254 RepID=UPI0025C36818|nr:polymer-forming cytoskeletal protein [Hydrogenophaga sp.]MBT9550669.1 polymer-forming cytoskeletal protein [Hydrogenophaga sp.]
MVQSLITTQKPSVVSEGFVMRGDIDSAGILHVEGSVIGTIQADDVNIGTAGLVEGTLTCKNLNIKGQVSGSVVCEELVVAPSAHIKGDVSYVSLTIGSGATIDCEMTCRTVALA